MPEPIRWDALAGLASWDAHFYGPTMRYLQALRPETTIEFEAVLAVHFPDLGSIGLPDLVFMPSGLVVTSIQDTDALLETERAMRHELQRLRVGNRIAIIRATLEEQPTGKEPYRGMTLSR